MVSTPKAPPPPDPRATAEAQGTMNRETAITNQNLNMVDQVTPEGNLSYAQTGTWADGTPRYQATQTLSPEQQRLYNLTNQTNANLGQIGVDQSAKIGELLSRPVNINNESTEARLMQLGSARLDPKFARQEEGLRSRLLNSGIREGSAAWNAEMGNFQEGKNDAYNQLLLTGRGQAVQEALTERTQPLNEITALMSGSQVSQPNYVTAPQTNVAGVDYAGLVNNNYNAQMQQWQAKVNSQNAMMGGLFGLAGGLGSMGIYKSDRRVKRDIERMGTVRGLPVYLYRYNDDPRFRVGFMAQDVERVNPAAVIEIGGVKHVDYSLVMEG